MSDKKNDKKKNDKAIVEESSILKIAKQLENERTHREHLLNFAKLSLSNNMESLLKYSSGFDTLGTGSSLLESVNLTNQLTEEKQRLSEQIISLRRQLDDSKQSAAEHSKKSNELNDALNDLRKRQSLHRIINSVGDYATSHVLKNSTFAEQFDRETCFSFVMSVDIRKSTDLMLKAESSRLFANFIRELCDNLRNCIFENYGVFDKFTGDGILAFFPDFFTGEDAGIYALKAAQSCHAIFNRIYETHQDSFRVFQDDAGLGIGIDCGNVGIVSDWGGVTIVGTPVVYACRLGGGLAGTTLLNQQAFAKIKSLYGTYFSFDRQKISVKNEGDLIGYTYKESSSPFSPKRPTWLESTSIEPDQKGR